MAAKQHSSFWSWASDHWFLTFLMGSSAISATVALARIARGIPDPPDPFASSFSNRQDPP